MRTRKRQNESKDRPARRLARTESPSNDPDGPWSSTLSSSRVPRVSLSPATQGSEDDGCNPLEMLPDDVLAKCLFGGYVNSLDIIARVSCVCNHTRRVAQETVKLLDLRKCQKMKPIHVENIVSRFQNLSVVDFNYCSQFSGRHLLKLVPVSRTLQTLHIRGSSVTDGDIVGYFSEVERFLGRSSLIKKLDVSAITKAGSTRIGDAAVVKIALSCPELEWLHLGWCTRVSDEAVRSLHRLHHLSDLDLSLCAVSAEACATLAKMGCLRNLDLSATTVGDSGIRILMGEKGEKEDSEETKIRLSDVSGYRSSLEVLKTRFNNDLSVQTLELVAARAPKLKTLDLCYCDALDRESTRAVYRDLKRNGTTVIDEHGKTNSAQS